MSWIKTNFLWMMYRSGWGTKPGQEVVLAIWLQRSAFNQILSLAVFSQFVPKLYSSSNEWQQAVKKSPIRLQWDLDHTPRGGKCKRRAIQLGLRGEILGKYSQDWSLHIQDISEFVREQYQYVQADDWNNLFTSSESVYPVIDTEIGKNLQISVL
jgi:hypothetical protein